MPSHGGYRWTDQRSRPLKDCSLEQLSQADKWRHHASVYAFLRARGDLKHPHDAMQDAEGHLVDDREINSPLDPEGKWRDEALIARMETYYRRYRPMEFVSRAEWLESLKHPWKARNYADGQMQQEGRAVADRWARQQGASSIDAYCAAHGIEWIDAYKLIADAIMPGILGEPRR